MKCNYSYDVLKGIYIAMLSRQVGNNIITIDQAKEYAVSFQLFIKVLQEDKGLAQTLKAEGMKALTNGND